MIRLTDLIKGTFRDPFTGKLYEGLIQTTDSEKAVEILGRKNLRLLKKAGLNDNEEIVLELQPQYLDYKATNYTTGSTHDREFNDLFQLINNLGYFPALVSFGFGFKPFNNSTFRDFIKNNEPSKVELILGAKYDKVVKLPKLVYHATSNINLDKIKQIGLKPVSKNKKANHPERVYVAFDQDDINVIAMQMNRVGSKDQSILTLDTTKFSESLVFYKDPHFIGGAYTLGNIPPTAIVNIEPYKPL